MKLLPPKYDAVFHALFREDTKYLLSKMLSTFLKEDISVKTIDKNRYVDIETVEEKLGIMDLRAELENQEQCNIEIQLNSSPDMIRRMLYYSDKCFVSQARKGEDYSKLKRTISVFIADFRLEELRGIEGPVTICQYRDEAGRVLTDLQTLAIIELPKARELYKKDPTNELYQWLMFLDNPNSKEVEDIMKNNKDIQDAISNLEIVSGDEKLARIAELREKAERDERSMLESATESGKKQGYTEGLAEGLVEGKELGLAEGKKEIIVNMLENKMSMEQIQSITKLSEEEIKKILKK